MKGILILIAVLLCTHFTAVAQPNARAAREREQNTKSDMSLRAQTRYPRSKSLPEDLIWMREIYRTLDLTKAANGTLYYPVEAMNDKQNLITTMFKLLAEKKIPAYEYMLDGTERLTDKFKVDFKDVLDRFQIFYETQRVGSRDTVLVINDSDIPSPEVKSYFIKEVWYFDQRTSTYGSVVTAICPVMHRADDYASEELKLPMFWVAYADIAPYLTQMRVMTSNLNNAATRSVDDFFVSRLYDGDIYKTTNMQDVILAQYCETDSALVKEQKRIEDELLLFEKRLFGEEEVIAKKDSIPATKAVKEKTTNTKRQRNTTVKESKSKSSSSKSSSGSARVSVRRQRR
ncbi:gliding motility protein GldN [Bacteroides sp. 214]|uniref:type IX secretion system ring protein PorN/GldN n=1 Tax=Bacteroides sp. 214 TaxID=2302935 RepID=UPI0013D7AE6D|nr:gliding motility protein GldN [Bacteroides sp. 214]NDW13042.1 gliding motility protein GldN [Bacteroides sp. 214]